jgi:hypothetical protein
MRKNDRHRGPYPEVLAVVSFLYFQQRECRVPKCSDSFPDPSPSTEHPETLAARERKSLRHLLPHVLEEERRCLHSSLKCCCEAQPADILIIPGAGPSSQLLETTPGVKQSAASSGKQFKYHRMALC